MNHPEPQIAARGFCFYRNFEKNLPTVGKIAKNRVDNSELLYYNNLVKL